VHKDRYIIADTHFSHKNILLYEPSRISKMNIEGYNSFDRFLIDLWNDTINPNDSVLHLGDFAFKDGYKVAKKLNGKVTIIKGNHDKKTHLDFYKSIGWRVIDNVVIKLDVRDEIYHKLKYSFSKERIENPLLCCLIEKIEDKIVMFSHFPVFDNNPYDEKYTNVTEILEFLFLECNCDINIHGHIHSKRAKERFCLNACLEYNGFEIMSVTKIMDKAKNSF